MMVSVVQVIQVGCELKVIHQGAAPALTPWCILRLIHHRAEPHCEQSLISIIAWCVFLICRPKIFGIFLCLVRILSMSFTFHTIFVFIG